MLRTMIVALLSTLLIVAVPGSEAQTGVSNGLVNPGFENPDEAWEEFFVYGGGFANASDASSWHTGSRAARLYAPVSSSPGALCDQGADAVGASIRQFYRFTVQDIVDSPDSFSVWWYILPDGDGVYSVRGIVWLEGYRLEYTYGISGLQNTSSVIRYDLGPVPVTGEWFQTRRNLYLDLRPLNLADPSSVAIAYVSYAAYGDCVSRGEIAWVDGARLLRHGGSYALPVAKILPGIFSGPAPLTVEFGAQPGAYVESYSWAADDGGQGSGLAWTHTFLLPGEYGITLTVEDSNGGVDVHEQKVLVTGGSETSVLQNSLVWIASGGLVFLLIVLILARRATGRRN